MASRGSVIPLWVEQMMEGKPITITDLNMTRFMMTLDDAVDLVMYAFEHGNNGDLFVQKAPAATLDVLAEALKQVYAKVDPQYGETEVKSSVLATARNSMKRLSRAKRCFARKIAATISAFLATPATSTTTNSSRKAMMPSTAWRTITAITPRGWMSKA